MEAARADPQATGATGVRFEGFVVGVGASAGGLEALERLFGALPSDTGAAFVVVQHLSPDHRSMMPELLARHTAMPVQVAANGMALTANAIFLIPPAARMWVEAGHLRLDAKPPHGLTMLIDEFFSSLAEQFADRAVAVVLSGTGSDGSRGLADVQSAGGAVFVQEPADARFDGMPRAALNTGLVDLVAPVQELVAHLADHLQGRHDDDAAGTPGRLAHDREPLEAIFDLLLAAGGVDFRAYKTRSVLRRLQRRMLVQRVGSLAEYHALLVEQPAERAVLRREMLIPVTRFFRDAEAFEQLAAEVLPVVMRSAPSTEPLRLWVACCATGEEAYSLAILVAEAAEAAGVSRPAKLFATDVEPAYIEQAALGRYPASIAAEVSPARLARWFDERDGHWCVKPELRQLVSFARHNVLADPPFTRMDLVSCRNALIYFKPAAQEQALLRLQFALKPTGYLFLGPSESLGPMQRDFTALPGRGRLYRLLRRASTAMGPLAARTTQLDARQVPRSPGSSRAAPDAAGWVAEGLRQLQRAYVPPSLLLGPARELLHVYGDATELLKFTEGQATLDVLKLLPPDLSWAVSLLWHEVADGRSLQHAVPASLGTEPAVPLRVVARRLAAAPGQPEPGPTLVSFEPMAAAAEAVNDAGPDADHLRRALALEKELAHTHARLQATIEELESANEELQAANEELMAGNEEMQSTNEELQSVNEELYTVNSEYQEKVNLLNSVNADLENVVRAAATPTLFVDEGLRLLRFTPELVQLFRVREGDQGRSIEDFAHLLDYPEMFNDLRRILAGGPALQREVRGPDGQWWLCRCEPYSTTPTAQRKAVMSFVNVSSLKDSQRLQAILDSLPEHVAVLDTQGNIVLVNDAWRQFAAANGDPGLTGTGPGCNYLHVCAGAALHEPDAQQAYRGLSDVLAGRTPRYTLQYPCHTAEKKMYFLMHAAPVRHSHGGAVVIHVDITPWLNAPPDPPMEAAP